MAAEWYYRNLGCLEEGPVTAGDLKRLARQGEIGQDTKVRKGVDGRWTAASKVKRLFDGIPVQPTTLGGESALSSWSDADEESAPDTIMPALRHPVTQGRHRSSGIESFDDAASPSLQGSTSRLDDSGESDLSPSTLSPKVLIGGGVCVILLVVGLIVASVFTFSSGPGKYPDQRAEAGGDKAKQKVEPADKTEHPVEKANPLFATPEGTVKGYLAATTWEDRLPYVHNADQVRAEMAKAYGNTRFSQTNFIPGTVVSVENRNAPLGGRCHVVVDVSTSSPSIPRWTYILVRTTDGFRVDWEESQANSKKEQEAAVQARLRELNPVIDVEVLRCKQSYSRTEIEFRLTNKSTAIFTYVAVTMSISNTKGEYLGSEYTNETNVRGGQSVVKTISFNNVKVDEVGSWKMSIKGVTIDQGDGRRREATNVFTLNEQLAGGDKGYKPKLESHLVGHWRTTGTDYYFSSRKPEVVIVDKEGVQRTFTMSVMERNYSTGAFHLRLISKDGTGHQRTVTIKDKSTVATQITHLALEVGEWRDLKEEVKAKLVDEWSYQGKSESP